MRTKYVLCFFAVLSLVVLSQSIEEEEEDPSRPVVEGQVDNDPSSNGPLVERKHRHENSRNNRINRTGQLVRYYDNKGQNWYVFSILLYTPEKGHWQQKIFNPQMVNYEK